MDYYLVRQPSDDFRIAIPATFPGIAAVLKDPVDFTIDMATQDDFQLVRIIANLGFVSEESTDQGFFTFNPPARLQVRFAANDLNRAQRRGKPLALGYWVEDHWQRFPPGNVPADPETQGDDWAYFLIHEIGDPPIAWGT